MPWIGFKEQINAFHVSCTNCGGDLRPNITLYSDNVSFDFNQACAEIHDADLVICAGTSLEVYPFASLMSNINSELLIIEPHATYSHTRHINGKDRYLYSGDCQKFARLCLPTETNE
jgi:NAD-dependent SIR2 family protein deacetylase